MSRSAAIVGAGSIGGWIADALDRAGWQVSMLARGDTLTALRGQGLKVTRSGETRISRPRVGAAQELGPQDYIFLTVKAQVLSGLAPLLEPLLGKKSVVISGTNGIPWWFFQGFGAVLSGQRLESVDPGGTQARIFPPDRVLGTVVHASARILAPAHIEVVAADRLIVGEPGGEDTERLHEVVDALRAGGINALASARIRLDVWTKLLGNMSMNPLSALTRSGTGRLLESTEVRELCVRMMEEMQACGRRLGLEMSMTPHERIAVTQRLGDFRTSMLADLDAKRPLELDPQIGAVVEMAARLGIDAPFSRAVLGLARLISP